MPVDSWHHPMYLEVPLVRDSCVFVTLGGLLGVLQMLLWIVWNP